MRIFILDGDRCGLDFALRCIAAGHDVRLFRPPGLKVRDGEGFKGLSITSDLKESIKWAGKDGLIVTTANCKYLDELDRWREFGYPIFAPTKASAKLEIDRGLGMEVMKQHGMNIPVYHEFKSLKDALAFARKADQAYVFKTLGSEEDKSLTFVPKDPGQLVGWIEDKIKKGMRLKGPCMLQEKVDMVAEVGIAGFMGRDGFLEDKWELSFEHKKLMSGDYGPATGEQGTVIQLVKESKLADILRGFQAHLRALGHMGDIAINGAVDTKGEYWPFEFTARAGWPDQYIRFSLHKGDPAQWMRDALVGHDTLKVSYDCAIGVVVAQKPYPYEDGLPEIVEGKPIYGVDEVAEHIHFAQVMMGKGPAWDGKKIADQPLPLTSGSYVLIATGHGKTVSKAQEAVYGVVDKISLQDMLVRDDIGKKLKDQLPKLHKLDIATEIEYE
jgi:phosphoribosylamine--glycine ligase